MTAAGTADPADRAWSHSGRRERRRADLEALGFLAAVLATLFVLSVLLGVTPAF